MAHPACARGSVSLSNVWIRLIFWGRAAAPYASRRDAQLLIIAIDRRGPDCGTCWLAQWSPTNQSNDPPIWFLLCVMAMLAFGMQPKGSDQICRIDPDRRLCEATDK